MVFSQAFVQSEDKFRLQLNKPEWTNSLLTPSAVSNRFDLCDQTAIILRVSLLLLYNAGISHESPSYFQICLKIKLIRFTKTNLSAYFRLNFLVGKANIALLCASVIFDMFHNGKRKSNIQCIRTGKTQTDLDLFTFIAPIQSSHMKPTHWCPNFFCPILQSQNGVAKFLGTYSFHDCFSNTGKYIENTHAIKILFFQPIPQ